MYDMNYSNFQKLLTEYRKSRGLTLEKLGEQIGKSKATISKYESGEIIPDILTVLEICNALHISLSQLFPIRTKNTSKNLDTNPFNTNKLYLYYYTENILITSILELIEEPKKIFVNFYNGIKNIHSYATNTSYYYEGILEFDKTIGYVSLQNPTFEDSLLEKIQISFTKPWSQNFEMTNFFILALTPNMLPIVKKGIISVKPLPISSIYLKDLKFDENTLKKLHKDNAWILENKNYDYFFFN